MRVCLAEQRVTGINDIRKMVSSFIEVEDRNFGMFRYIQVRTARCRAQATLGRLVSAGTSSMAAAIRLTQARALLCTTSCVYTQPRRSW